MSQKRHEKLIKLDLLEEHALHLLEKRGVSIEDIAEIVLELQQPYIPEITLEECCRNVRHVLSKREVQYGVITAIEIDIATEKGSFSPILTEVLMHDEGLYGVDEILALSITNIYGSIGLTNFGYVDKVKMGIVAEMDEEKSERCNTFIDDIIAALAAAAASRIAHAQPARQDVDNH